MGYMKKWKIAAMIVEHRMIGRGMMPPSERRGWATWLSRVEREVGIQFLGTMPNKWTAVARVANYLSGQSVMMRAEPNFALWLKEQPEVSEQQAWWAKLTVRLSSFPEQEAKELPIEWE